MTCKQVVLESLALALSASIATSAAAQKSGGIVRVPLSENPPSASLLEEVAPVVNFPFMPVFNNLVLFDQQDRVARAESIKPDLATEWSWSTDHKALTLKLRQGVKWHDGKPFTSADVQCTWETIMGKRDAGWRKNPYKEWYQNLKEVAVNGPYEVKFTLERPQPSFMTMLASGWSAVYPCHVEGRAMRQRPIGTGPFKVAEFKPHDVIRLVKNADYWKPGLPYLDGIEHKIIPSQATRTLAFVSGQYDITSPGDVSAAIHKDIAARAPKAVCETLANVAPMVVTINHAAPSMQDPRVRRAISLALDRDAFVTAMHGYGRLGGVMTSPPHGNWGLAPEQLEAVPGYGKDVEKNRAEARKLMEEAGYGPNKKLRLTYFVRSTRNYVLAMTLAADQLRTIYIEGEIEQKEVSVMTGMLVKGAFTLAVLQVAAAFDDPDIVLYGSYSCNSPRNYSRYCNKEIEAKIHEQSATLDPLKRKQLVQQIDLMLQQNIARPTLFHALGTQCWHPHVKGFVRPVSGGGTHNRMENVWLDR